MLMQRQRSARAAARIAVSGVVSGLKATPTPSPCSRASAIIVSGSSATSTWDVTLGVVDHQVAVDHAAAAVDERRDRLEHDRPHRHRLDEVTVADVEMEDASARVHEDADLLAEVGKVRRVQRRLDLHHPHPVAPGHASARSYVPARLEEATVS